MARTIRPFFPFLIAGALLLAGCNSSTQALDAATPAPASPQAQPAREAGGETAAAEAPKAEEAKETAKVIHKPSTVTQKGNYIVALVNGEPVTNYDVQRRKKFRALRQLKTSTEETISELVDEKLKLQEAARLGLTASDAQVTQALANFAKNNRSTPARISGDLDRIGVGASHFKEFIRSQISWSRTVGTKLQSETRSMSQADALFELRKTGGTKPETTEYQLKQIIFVIPNDKRGTLMKSRKAEALAFAQRFTGCASAIDMAKGLRDVAVKDLGRIMVPELPPEWSDEVQKTAIDKTTAPKETEMGVELLAVCSARVVDDDRAAQVVSQSEAFGSLQEKGDAAGDELLQKLRKSAVIVYK